MRNVFANRIVQITAAVVAAALIAVGVYFLFADSSEGGDGPRVTDVTMARNVTQDFQPQGVTFTFPTDAARIWAVVSLENVTRALRVTGSWSYLGPLGKGDPVRMAEASVDVDPGENLTRRSGLSLSKQSGFDAGVYQVEVLVDGKRVKVLQFNVVPPNQISGGSATAAPVTATATARPAGSTTPAPTAAATVAPTATRPPAVTPQQSVQGTAATPTPEPTEPPPATPTPIPTATTVPGTYIVKPGETLAGIAGQLGVSVDLLASANNITNPSAISAGQVLVIPTPPPSR